MTKEKTMTIIGAGEMGEWFANRMANETTAIEILDSDKSKEEALVLSLKAKGIRAYRAWTTQGPFHVDEIMLAIPTEAAYELVSNNRDLLRGKVVYDIASVKNGLISLLGEVSDKSFSLHPMWGGATHNLTDQNLIILPTRDLKDPKYSVFFEEQTNRFEQLGANVVGITTGEKHDRLMAWNLAFYHGHLLAMGYALSQSGISMSDHRKVEGTTATLARVGIESVVHSNPKLYADIQMKNPYVAEAWEVLTNSLMFLRDIVLNRDYEGFSRVIQESQRYFLEGRPLDAHLVYAKQQFAQAAGAAKRVEYGAQHQKKK